MHDGPPSYIFSGTHLSSNADLTATTPEIITAHIIMGQFRGKV